jgi:hypothetical protein
MTHKELAKELKITRQAVSKLVRRGMPTTSAEAAQFWRQRNTRRLTRYVATRLPPMRCAATASAALPDDDPLQSLTVGDDDFNLIAAGDDDLALDGWQSLTVDQRISIAIADFLSGEFDDIDREVPTIEHAIAFSKLTNEVLRHRLRQLPAEVAAAANPDNPAQAKTAMEEWLAAFKAEMFLPDGECKPALRWPDEEQPGNGAT